MNCSEQEEIHYTSNSFKIITDWKKEGKQGWFDISSVVILTKTIKNCFS